jgi:iron complex transport system substrate-binding protein
LDWQQLAVLRPTHILTQAQCDVCAVSLKDVEEALIQITHQSTTVISLQPNRLEDIWQDMQRVATALGTNSQGVIAQLQTRINSCWQQTQAVSHRPTVACIEWTDPLMIAGNWVPELVELAGGNNCLGITGQHSTWLSWDQLIAVNPEILVCMPCGFNLEQTAQATQALAQHPHWQQLRAVQAQQVYLTDGNQYFNRPGPRLVDSMELLAEIFHPHIFMPTYAEYGWQRYH